MNFSSFLSPAEITRLHELTESEGSQWDHPDFIPIKTKIKEKLLEECNCCCYCRRTLTGEFKMTIDIEHILPKGTYERFEFIEQNLTLACKRCNMNVKNQRTDFLKNSSLTYILANPFNLNNYRIPHPIFEDYNRHISRISLEFEDNRFLKYIIVNNSKGDFTYEFFRLKEFEVETLNQIQGLKENNKLDQLPSHIQDMWRDLFQKE